MAKKLDPISMDIARDSGLLPIQPLPPWMRRKSTTPKIVTAKEFDDFTVIKRTNLKGIGSVTIKHGKSAFVRQFTNNYDESEFAYQKACQAVAQNLGLRPPTKEFYFKKPTKERIIEPYVPTEKDITERVLSPTPRGAEPLEEVIAKRKPRYEGKVGIIRRF